MFVPLHMPHDNLATKWMNASISVFTFLIVQRTLSFTLSLLLLLINIKASIAFGFHFNSFITSSSSLFFNNNHHNFESIHCFDHHYHRNHRHLIFIVIIVQCWNILDTDNQQLFISERSITIERVIYSWYGLQQTDHRAVAIRQGRRRIAQLLCVSTPLLICYRSHY